MALPALMVITVLWIAVLLVDVSVRLLIVPESDLIPASLITVLVFLLLVNVPMRISLKELVVMMAIFVRLRINVLQGNVWGQIVVVWEPKANVVSV